MTLPFNWKELWQQARTCIIAQQYQQAQEILTPMMQQDVCLDLGLDTIQVLMKCRQWSQAQGLLRFWLQSHPSDHRLHGIQAQIDYSRGAYSEAKTRYQQLLVSAPQEPKYWVNLAYCYAALSDLKGAIKSFERSAPLLKDPDARWYYNYGMSLLLEKQPSEALPLFEKCAPVYPHDLEFCFHYALAHDLCGLEPVAAQLYESNTQKWPNDLRSWHNWAILCYRSGHNALAQKLLQQVLILDPKHPIAHPLSCALAGEELETFPSLFLQMLFDQYAFNYDTHLKDTLNYQAPLIARQLLTDVVPELQAGVVYDLGCGTGLLAPVVRDIATDLIGFDLSEGMLAQARQQGLYEHLVTARIPQELALYHKVPDYIFAIELSNYLGADWERCLQRVSEILTPGGLFVFTIETHQSLQPYILHEHARYSYQPDWVREILRQYGLNLCVQKEAALRSHKDQDALGLYVVAQKKN